VSEGDINYLLILVTHIEPDSPISDTEAYKEYIGNEVGGHFERN
jgi:hypothetical protein